MKLMIIESPGKVKKLSSILGKDWTIAASVGHVRDLPAKAIGVAAPDYKPDYELTERGIGVIKKLAGLVKQADAVYLATDPDREGEAIAWHLKQCLRLKNPIRVAFGEITPKAVKAALNEKGVIDTGLVGAQEARRVLDRLVGYKVSPKLSNQAGRRLSAGRVQSPAVRLVVEREREIAAFTVTQHFGALLRFQGEQEAWTAEWLTKPDFVTDDSPYFMDRNFAQAVAGIDAVEVLACDDKTVKRSPPAPFTTSTLQQAASVALGMNPKATMSTAQKLYEQGYITYHRTDNPNISDEAMPDIKAVAEQMGLPLVESMRRFKASADAQAGHPAITPTHWEVESAGDTDEQQALYRLIRVRAIACQLADALYAVRVVRLSATESESGKVLTFEGRGRTLTEKGWLALLDGDQTEEEKTVEADNPVPVLGVGDSLQVIGGEVLEKATKPPARFTEASLVKKLDSAGIGRPATYAAIMSNIMDRGYVETKQRFLYPTSTGELIVDALVGKFAFVELAFTRDVEKELDRIAEGEANYKDVVAGVAAQLEQELAALHVEGGEVYDCPECGSAMRQIKGKHGLFWGCSSHPECSCTLPDDNGKPGKRKAAATSEFVCDCGKEKPLVHRHKAGKKGYDFFGCSDYRNGCTKTYKNKGGKPVYESK